MRRSALAVFAGYFESLMWLFHIAEFCLGGAHILVGVALDLLLDVADRPAGDFLHFARPLPWHGPRSDPY